jgi:hypothetical protein
MSVEIITADRDGYFTPSEGAAYYGRARSLEEIVIHHWDSKEKRLAGQVSFNGVLQHLLHAGVPSANDVIGFDEGAGRVRTINSVTYPNVAFTSGSSYTARGKYINQVSVGFECDPLAEVAGHPQQAAILEAIAQRALDYCKLVDRLLPLNMHRDYAQTACPGDMPMDTLRNRLAQLWNAYKNPAPAPAPKPAITYRAIEPHDWLCNLDPTKLWNLDFNKYPEAQQVATYSKGHPVTVVGIATHPLGSEYFMTAYALGTTDVAKINAPGFKPFKNQGFNKKDMVQAPEPQPIPPAPTPTPAPAPEPTPTPTPNPTQQTDYDKAQDARISVLEGTLNSLIALLREFAQNILSKFKG